MITSTHIPESQRLKHTAQMFGTHFPSLLEPTVYAITDHIATEYSGGFWEFFALSNGGFYMAPSSDADFKVSCENGYQGTLSADALGITVCLYAYSHLSFSNNPEPAEMCAQQFHLLRDYMLDHSEVEGILRAID